MNPDNLSESSAYFWDAVPVEATAFEYDGSGLLLDDPTFGFPGGSLFPEPVIDAAVE